MIAPRPIRWPDTPLAKRLGLEWPILQAPMAGATTPELAAAVGAAGGLGALGCAIQSVEASHAQISAFRQQSNRVLNVNFFCHETPQDVEAQAETMRARLAPYYEEARLGDVPEATEPFVPFGPDHLDLVTDLKPEIISFHFGLPDDGMLAAVRGTGAFILSTATTVAEARYLADRGVDAIIAQGTEAGGHRGHFLETSLSQHSGLMSLLPQVVDAVDVPVIAAGGIADGRGIAAAMMLGAQAVQIGTAFLRCPESATPETHKSRLRSAEESSTRFTRLFSGRPARGVVNGMMAELAEVDDQSAPYPTQLSLVAPLAKALPEDRRADVSAIWAGQSVAMGRDLPARDLFTELAREADALLGPLAKSG